MSDFSEVRSGYVAGSLEHYRSGYGVVFGDIDEGRKTPMKHEEPTEPLSQKLAAFEAVFLVDKPEATDNDVVSAFIATLDEAEPTPEEESLTLSDVDSELMDMQLRIAQMSLDNL